LRARPEPTQLEHLSDASFLGKVLVLPANVRLAWEVITSYKHSSLLYSSISDKKEKIYNIDTRKKKDPVSFATARAIRVLPVPVLHKELNV
jgi:hypothetical protein